MSNKLKCKKCGDIIQSKHRHDMVWCKCGAIAIDGGGDYCKVSGNLEDIEFIKEEPEVFTCEICGTATLKELEGSQPNTCANCMPLGNDIDVLRKRSSGDMDKLPREDEIRQEQSKFCKIWHDMKVGDYCVSLEFGDYRNVIKGLLNKMSKEDLIELIWENLSNKELDEIFQEELKEMYKVDD